MYTQLLTLLLSSIFLLAAPAKTQTPPSVGQPHTPILVYHHILDNGKERWFVTPKAFEEQLAYLKAHNFHTVSMDTYTEALTSGKALADKSIVLTFDDGYEDMYTSAFPLLKQYGFTGTFYIITGRVGSPGYLTWDQIVEMQQAGMEIGGHTVHHVMLTQLSLTNALWEMAQCKADLEAHIHVPVTTFAYPFNDHNPLITTLVKLVGYKNAVIVDWHSGDQEFTPYRVARITVDSGESMPVFELVTNRGYEPFHWGKPIITIGKSKR